MSRSRKKTPIIKDNGKSHRYYKKKSHAVTRARVKNLLGNSISYEDLLFPTQKSRELINQYDICDWIWRLDLTVRSFIGYNGLKYTIKPNKKDILRYYRK